MQRFSTVLAISAIVGIWPSSAAIAQTSWSGISVGVRVGAGQDLGMQAP